MKDKYVILRESSPVPAVRLPDRLEAPGPVSVWKSRSTNSTGVPAVP